MGKIKKSELNLIVEIDLGIGFVCNGINNF